VISPGYWGIECCFVFCLDCLDSLDLFCLNSTSSSIFSFLEIQSLFENLCSNPSPTKTKQNKIPMLWRLNSVCVCMLERISRNKFFRRMLKCSRPKWYTWNSCWVDNPLQSSKVFVFCKGVYALLWFDKYWSYCITSVFEKAKRN
jgi:hypothetical protein